MKLFNGSTYNSKKISAFEVIDNNIVRHKGMQRIQSKNKVPFQVILHKIKEDNYQISDDAFKALAEQLLYLPPLKDRDKTQMFSASDTTIIDCYNDTTRRYFESLFAKKILIHLTQSGEHKTLLSLLIKELTHFYQENYLISKPSFITQWNEAKEGKTVNDDNLAFFATQRPDLVNLIAENHFDSDANILLELYDLHYLTHSLKFLTSYKENYPEGIFELYDKKKNTYYANANRGRVNGFGFAKDNPSYHLGIFRSIDKVPCDMRKSVLTSNTTRCPDRVYMVHPKVARQNPLDWLNYSFSNPSNALYVLGLSGSTLLEARAMMFLILSVVNKRYECKFIDPDFFKNKALLNNYYLLIISLFVYFEGGHSLSEIFTVFDIEEVRTFIDNTLGETNALSKSSLVFAQDKILLIMKDALIETAKYNAILEQKEMLHSELEKKFRPSTG